MLATSDSNKFNHKDKIGEFKYIDIKNLVNNIKNNTISEIDAKKELITLNKIKNAQIVKYKKRRTTTQKELLNLVNNLLKTILTNKLLMSSKDDGNEIENENVNENDKDNDNENANDNDNMIKQLNDSLD